jgi:cholesterol transport system auxiliary component
MSDVFARSRSGVRLRAICAAAATLALAGCSSLLAGAPPPATYDLTAPSKLPRSGGGGSNLVVGEPVAVAVIDGQRIVVKPNPGEVTYLPNAQWSDRLPKLVQAKIIEAYENSNRLKTVGRPGDRLSVDYQLVSELRSFEIDAAANQAAVELTAKIVNDKTGKVVAAEVFSARRSLAGPVEGAVATRALDAALAEVLTKLVVWTGGRV